MAVAAISKDHQVSVIGREISCGCGLGGHVPSDEAAVRLRVGHAHVANPGVPFEGLLEFVAKGSGL